MSERVPGFETFEFFGASDRAHRGSTEIHLDMTQIASTVWRRRAVLVAILASVFAASVIYVVKTPMKQTATTTVLISSGGASSLHLAQPRSDQQEASFIETQVQLARSGPVLGRVVSTLNLSHDPEFGAPDPMRIGLHALLSRFLKRFGVVEAVERIQTSDETVQEATLEALQRAVSVARVGHSSLINISASSHDASKAAAIANAVAAAYLQEREASRDQRGLELAHWLMQRIDASRSQLLQAEAAVSAYKNSPDVGGPAEAALVDKQIEETTAQLGGAAARANDARTNFERMKGLSADSVTVESQTEALHSDLIEKLRIQYADLSRNLADVSKRYGPNHPLVLSAVAQQQALRTQIADALAQIANNYKSEYEIAAARQNGLKAMLASLERKRADLSDAQLRLKDLQRDVDSRQAMLQSLTEQYKQSSVQDAAPVEDARVVSAADAHHTAHAPNRRVILVGSLALGFLGGLMGAFAAEHIFGGFYDRRDIEAATGLPLLAKVPKLRRLRGKPSQANRAFAEEIRRLRLAVQLSEARVFAIGSATPQEGRSTIAKNLADACALSGAKTLLIQTGSHESEDGSARSSSVLSSPSSRTRSKESQRRENAASSAERPLYKADVMQIAEHDEDNIFARREGFDFVIVDLPSFSSAVAALEIAYAADKLVLVVRQTHTPRSSVRRMFEEIGSLNVGVLGVVLNAAPRDPPAWRRGLRGAWRTCTSRLSRNVAQNPRSSSGRKQDASKRKPSEVS